MTIEVVAYFALIALWSAVLSYLILFRGASKSAHQQGGHGTSEGHGGSGAHASSSSHGVPDTSTRRFSPHEGFRSLAKGAELTVEDIVKALSRD